jgi:hypothetical protein
MLVNNTGAAHGERMEHIGLWLQIKVTDCLPFPHAYTKMRKLRGNIPFKQEGMRLIRSVLTLLTLKGGLQPSHFV